MKGSKNQDQIIEEVRDVLYENRFFLKAVLTVFLLTSIIIALVYPWAFWFVTMLGGVVSVTGILLKRKILITFGIVFMGATFFLSNLAVELSPFDAISVIGMFMLLYGAIIYLNNMVRIDIIWRESHEGIEDKFDRYMKKWNRSVIKSLSFAFLLALLAFIIAWIGTFEFWIQLENIVLLGASSLFTVVILGLLYILFIKLPSFYRSGE